MYCTIHTSYYQYKKVSSDWRGGGEKFFFRKMGKETAAKNNNKIIFTMDSLFVQYSRYMQYKHIQGSFIAAAPPIIFCFNVTSQIDEEPYSNVLYWYRNVLYCTVL
jgi:hypothetical protein